MDSETLHPGPSCEPPDLPTGPQITSDRRTTAQKVERGRKRKHSSKDSSQVGTGDEGSLHKKKRHKPSVKQAEPKANGHQDGLAHCPEPQGTDPPSIRKSLVNFLRGTSEEIYADTIQMQAQQQDSLLTPEELSQLRQLSGALTAMVDTFYSLAKQAGFAFPAEGWLVPAPMPAPQELSAKESQSPLLEGGEKEKITHAASPTDKS